MDDLTIFDKLIINLSSNEKKELLEKMEMTFELSQEPLSVPDEEIESDFNSFQQEYESLTIVQKIFLFIESLVKQKDIPTILKEHKVHSLRKKYFQNCEFADFKNSLLKQEFYNEILKLKDPCQFFRKPLQKIFSFDDKQDFYAFIGGVILPDLQNDLLVNTDPWEIEKNDHKKEDGSIKSDIDSFLEMKLDSISNLDCSIMNEACQSLYGLYLLCSFDLNRITKYFDSVIAETGKMCRIADVQDLLLELSGILRSLNKPPTIRAMEALFLYSLEDHDLKEDLNKKMTTSDMYLSSIRDFNRKIPLEKLVKVLSGDLSKHSKIPPLIEDWFRIYKKFWNTRVNRKYALFINERKKNASEKEICSLTGLKLIKTLDRYSQNYFWLGSPAKYEKSMAFIQAFMHEVLEKKIYPTLFIISKEGEFYKKDNKLEFDKAVDYLGLLEKKLLIVSSNLKDSIYLSEKSIHEDRESEEKRKRMIISALEQTDFEVLGIIDSFIANIRVLNNIMHGIVIGNGGAYDTLSNISSIGGRSNTELRETFKQTSVLINKILKFIIDMKILEEKS